VLQSLVEGAPHRCSSPANRETPRHSHRGGHPLRNRNSPRCAEVEFYAFDILVSDGEDLRGLPLSMRKASLSRLLARRVDRMFLSDFERGEIGPDLFRHACLMGLEGMVSKHRESLYRGGRFRHWVKIKNRAHPAFTKAALRVKIMLRCVREFSRLRLHFGTGEP